LTLNSANILIPRLENYPQLLVMALFNSSLYAYIYRQKFFSRKILRSHLEELPLPILSTDQQAELLAYVNNYLMTELTDILTDIDGLVFRLFGLNEEEIKRVAGNNS